MSQITPFVKRMRTQGGTIYTFSSALEDIGLNINERNNIVKMSYYALLNIPEIGAPANLNANTFNVLAIPGAFQSFLTEGNIKDGRVIIAESFQDYALNLETNLISQTSYNAALNTTVSERVFWKWLKETGAIRWLPINTSAGTYWQEETVTSYDSVVQAVGQISAGSVRTDTFGTYNETYVLVPTSFGQSPVFFKQIEDDNYYHGLSILNGNNNILGRENYLQPHPDGLDLQAYYDLPDSSIGIGAYKFYYDDSTGFLPGLWWTREGFPTMYSNCYFIDTSSYIAASDYNISIRYNNGSQEIDFQRSKVDCLSLEFNLDNLKTIMGDSTLTFDSLATSYSIDTQYDFNAILLYYSVYNKSLDTILATNLLGVLFLDPPSGNTSAYPITQIVIPSITKLQSGPTGFGTSYSFRLNIKSDYMLDDTAAPIVDESTSSQIVLEDFSQVFDSLEKSLTILNQNSGTISYITQQYLDISENQTNILNKVNDLSNQVNAITQDITGTPGAIAMFVDATDPIADSSIYMNNGKIGFFEPNPSYSAQFDVSVKVMDLILEKAIRDISGNILLGYGSPLQIGDKNSYKQINVYLGSSNPILTFDSSITFSVPVNINASVYQNGTTFSGGGGGGVSQPYVDGSLNYIKAAYGLPDSSIDHNSLVWNIASNKLYVVSSSSGGIMVSDLHAYVDPSLLLRSLKTDVNSSTNAIWNYFLTVNASITNLDSSVYNTYSKSQADNKFATTATFSTTSNGLVPASTTGDDRFLKANGNWSVSTDSSIFTLTSRHNYTETSLGYLSPSYVDSSFGTRDNSISYIFTNYTLKSYVDTSIGNLKTYTDGSLGTLKTYTDGSLGTRLTNFIIMNGSLGIGTYSPSYSIDTSGNFRLQKPTSGGLYQNFIVDGSKMTISHNGCYINLQPGYTAGGGYNLNITMDGTGGKIGVDSASRDLEFQQGGHSSIIIDVNSSVNIYNVLRGHGDAYFSGQVVAYYSFSDQKLKENISPLTPYCLDVVTQLSPIKFKYKEREGDHFGFIAQEVQKIIPEIVEENEFLDKGTFLTLRSTEIIPFLVQAVKELKKEVEELKQKIK